MLLVAVVALLGCLACLAVLVLVDWRFWLCLLLGHRWRRVEPFVHVTGVLSRRARHRCRRCGAVPGIFEEPGA